MSEHAKLSPSGAEKWMTCPGSAALEAGEPDSSNDYSDEGTAAHFLASECLVTRTDAAGFKGQQIGIWGGRAAWFGAFGSAFGSPSNTFEVDDGMVTHVQTYLDKVREYANGGTLHVEQRMSIGHLTGEADAAGTGDAVIVQDGEIIVADLKYGMREVDGERNKQLMIYALAALEKFSMYEGEFTTIRTVIIQPRIGHFPEWSCTVEELQAFAGEVRAAAVECHKAVEFSDGGLVDMRGWLVPGAHCQKNYCKARATCPALSKFVTDAINMDFEDLTSYGSAVMQADPEPVDLGKMMQAIPMIEDWCKAVRAKVESKLFAGEPVPGYKLVQGKKGNRQWTSKDEAEAMLKGFKLKVEEMYDLKLVSPTTAEKLAKAGTIGPRQWPKLSGYITQSEGSPSVAPESDKRPALDIKPAAEDFEDLTTIEDMI
jgi:uncharacterized protein DUF2800